MLVGEPHVEVTCENDVCGCTEDVNLGSNADGSYHLPSKEDIVAELDWVEGEDGKLFCSNECALSEEDSGDDDGDDDAELNSPGDDND